MGLATLGIRPADPERERQVKRLQLLREKRIRVARRSLWEFCKTESPEFYTDQNWHLRILTFTLQSLYDRNLTKARLYDECVQHAPAWFIESFDWDRMEDGRVYRKLIINMPPRTGKSRTLINFCKWAYGQDHTNKIITGSYNDDTAQDFSRYTRDGIQEVKTYPHEIVYADVFPNVQIKRGDAAFGKWALEGRFFSYKGSGVGGSVTGKGCNISIVDDPVKDAEEAFNDNRLDVIWRWYSGTFRSRLEQDGIQIVNMTRWADRDICGRLLSEKEPTGKRRGEWCVLRMSACDDVREGGTGEMLAPSMLNRETYEELRDSVDEYIFNANYRQEPADERNRMYPKFRTYDTIPTDQNGNPLWEQIMSYTDTADTGEDYLASIVAGVYQGKAYILDVLYTQEPMEETEIETAAQLKRCNVNIARIESNSGGRGFARNVGAILRDKYKAHNIVIKWFHQSKNKRSRIFSNSAALQQNIYFPNDWRTRWPEYYRAMTEYKREGKNLHDDAPDATTGLLEYLVKSERKQPKAISLN